MAREDPPRARRIEAFAAGGGRETRGAGRATATSQVTVPPST